MVSTTARPRPFLRLRGKSFMSVVLTPELPEADWFAQLDEQIGRSPKVFEGRPVLLDVSLFVGHEAKIPAVVAALESRGVRVIGIDGTAAHALGEMAAGLPPVMSGGRNAALMGENEPGYAPAAGRAAAAPSGAASAMEPSRAGEPTSLVLDQAVRSGQSVTHTAGDVTVVGSVASGAEVIAGGSIHVYGTLRGRAIAGLLGSGAGSGGRPRIFCRRLEAELIAIDGVYRTADEIQPALFGRAVQAWLEDGELRVAALE